MNYINAIEPKQESIIINNTTYDLQRCCLKDYYRLRQATEKIQSEEAIERLEGYFEYIEVAAPNIDVDSIALNDIVRILNKLIDLNNIELLPWQTTKNVKGKIKKTNTDYEMRELSLIVHLLAESYGWTQEYVLSLQPESVFCHVQEILLSEWKKDDYQWKLSEVAYDKEGRLRDYPSPEWYTEIIGPAEEEAKFKVPMKFVPDGVVIDPTKKEE